MVDQTPIASVIIVGGSLAGLMHALVLLSLPNPPTVHILERSPSALLHDQGAGIVAGSETQQFFDEVVRAGREIAVTSPRRQYLDRSGNVIPDSVEHRAQRMTSWDLLYHLIRWRVDGLESEYVHGLQPDNRPKATYENGSTVTSISDAGADGVEVTWTKAADRQVKTAKADVVIAADGASSTIRRLLEPNVQRTYAGYVAWRGTVPETGLSTSAQQVLEGFTFYHTQGSQVLGYTIPGVNGTLNKSERLFNWVWYVNYEESSAQLDELMTDTNGKRHAITLPVGGMQDAVWAAQKRYAADTLPPQFAEAVEKTRQPFVQAITDVIGSRCNFMDGKVLVVGDALAGFRPHTAASTTQAAFDALRLGELLGGKIDRDEYERQVMEFASKGQKHGVMLGERSQFGRHPFAK